MAGSRGATPDHGARKAAAAKNAAHDKLLGGEIDKFGRVVAGVGAEKPEKFHTIDYARQWRERVRHENAISVDHAPYRVDTHGRNRTWLEPVKPQNFDPYARPANKSNARWGERNRADGASREGHSRADAALPCVCAAGGAPQV